MKLVKRQTAKASTKAAEGKAGDTASTLRSRILTEPERLGRVLYDRPGWLDEIVSILLIVFGMVSMLSLLNSSSTAALTSLWSNTIRQIFGQVGAVLLSIMIALAGALILLPRIGIIIRISWTRIVIIEVAFFAFLAVLHLLARDTEPRALARSGQGGGYIGWALSEIPLKLLGQGLTLALFIGIAVVAIGAVLGIRRKHIRAGLLTASKRLEALAEYMKNAPQRRRALPAGAGHVRQIATADPALAAEPVTDTHRKPDVGAGPMARPLRQPNAPARPVGETPAPTSAQLEPHPPAPPAALDTPVENRPTRTTKSKPPKPVPVVPERRTRYFTVEDFKEVRQTYPRNKNLPPLTLLSDIELNKPTEQEINNNVRIIENTLLEFDIDVEVVDVKVGPTVTQYAVQPFREVTNDQGEVVMQRVRVNKIASLSSDLALALSAKRLRIQPYVPGHQYMGIEVPNHVPSTVALRPVMESEAFAKAYIRRDPDNGQTYEAPLATPLGRDVSGAAFVADLAGMPHLLIAGTTGSGKSVFITAVALSLVMSNTPERLKLVMLDPKMVELTRFNGLPHLLGPVETDMERIIGVLRWATREMDRRYKLLEAEAARNIEIYNKALGQTRAAERLPYIVIMIDEIGDLMLSRPDEMERTLTRLAQMARAVGIHLVVATQRPSVDIITGLIKANFPARISFAVASGVDSRVILDTTGAETLIGRGDMLYLAPDASGPQRLQGCFVSDQEIDGVLDYWRKWKTAHQDSDSAANPPWEVGMTRRDTMSDQEPMLEDAIALVVREGEASASLLQRRLGIGYPRAAQLLDMLVELGVAGGLKEGGRSREVLLKPGQDNYRKLMENRKK
jgi:S-DNA-T family DNA segregation ATPase FtsK/SpoIIIE